MPDFQDALEMKAEVDGQLVDIDTRIAALKQQTTTSPSSAEPESTKASDKWNKDDHPAFRKQHAVIPSPVEEKKVSHSFKVNDTVTARYSGDKQFYEARIISITGSSNNPIYTVNFKGYSGTETVRGHEMRPLAAPVTASTGQKRKADDSPISNAFPAHTINAPASGVISAAPSIDAEKAEALRKEAAAKALDTKDKPKAAKKARNNKALEDSKNNWQTWQVKASKGKAAKVASKDSMFRTGEAPTARGMFFQSACMITHDGFQC